MFPQIQPYPEQEIQNPLKHMQPDSESIYAMTSYGICR